MTRFVKVEAENKTKQEIVAAHDLQVGITPDNMPSNFKQRFDESYFTPANLKKLKELGIETVGDFRFYTMEALVGHKLTGGQRHINAIDQMLNAQNGWTLDTYQHDEDGVEIVEDRLFRAGFMTPDRMALNQFLEDITHLARSAYQNKSIYIPGKLLKWASLIVPRLDKINVLNAFQPLDEEGKDRRTVVRSYDAQIGIFANNVPASLSKSVDEISMSQGIRSFLKAHMGIHTVGDFRYHTPSEIGVRARLKKAPLTETAFLRLQEKLADAGGWTYDVYQKINGKDIVRQRLEKSNFQNNGCGIVNIPSPDERTTVLHCKI